MDVKKKASKFHFATFLHNVAWRDSEQLRATQSNSITLGIIYPESGSVNNIMRLDVKIGLFHL